MEMESLMGEELEVQWIGVDWYHYQKAKPVVPQQAYSEGDRVKISLDEVIHLSVALCQRFRGAFVLVTAMELVSLPEAKPVVPQIGLEMNAVWRRRRSMEELILRWHCGSNGGEVVASVCNNQTSGLLLQESCFIPLDYLLRLFSFLF
ncbi:uncharacterized protein LOC116025183 isoform X2 [Ipomoea triloba]|uniref:uncharacterized protein LOC116025183 isoform X2 n=1 Tax=Ipomoea triloba TaxID=35885 RepID=UPI00125D245D|nr:uncharacterized protein LOC116025183 isoform X2 [Ipomoea triloba]XP_031122186.1 uncharacterized protein LOC116025183 isoform X2 [Ipomoea triloba]XP_031122187.1 uncharacterized protein LOC116025183 isoform X2 [Ipomoea triloba]